MWLLWWTYPLKEPIEAAVNAVNFNKLWAFNGYVIEKVMAEDVGVQVKMRFDRRRKPCCVHCGRRCPVHGTGAGLARDLPVADHTEVYVTYPLWQVYCKHCKLFSTARPPEVHPSRGATWRLLRHVSAWASQCAATTVAAMFGISDSSVRRYDKDVLEADLPGPSLDGIEVLLVDEKSVRRRHGYVTVVLNGRSGELLFMEEGKKKEVLGKFLAGLGPEQKASIRAVCIDRNGAYKAAIEEHLPHAEIVHDLFHLMMNLNAAIDETRRAEWHKASAADKSVIKGSRYLLLGGRENLTDSAIDRLARLVSINEPLTKAYVLKESFRDIFRLGRSPNSARRSLIEWCEDAMASGLARLAHFAKGIVRDLRHVIGYFKHHITSGPIESFNNQIARVIHRACGMTDIDYLFLKMRAQSLQRI